MMGEYQISKYHLLAMAIRIVTQYGQILTDAVNLGTVSIDRQGYPVPTREEDRDSLNELEDLLSTPH